MAPGGGQFRYATFTNSQQSTLNTSSQQPQRFIRMMDVQRNPIVYPVGYGQNAIGGSGGGGGARFPRNTDKSRGLRHFSSRVCEKVKEKVQTNYNEVADELVTEYFDSLPYAPQNPDKQQYDAKNIRRRVYDALNVLMAMNIIEKEKKEIRWVGLPTSSLAEKRRLEEERAQRQERIRQKSDQLREYIIQLVAYKSLVHRNRELERCKGCPPDQAVLFLPFIIVNTERKTVVECAISHDKTEYAMTFERPFEIHDDIEVLKRLGLAYGLDVGRVADEHVEQVKQCLPPVLRVYVDQILDQPETVQIEEDDDGVVRNRTEVVASEETVITEDDKNISVHFTDPRELSLTDSSGSATSAPPPKLVKQVLGNASPQRRYISLSRGYSQQSPGNESATHIIQQQYGANVAVTRPIKRTYIQQQSTRPVASRYVQPSQSAVYQTAQQQRSGQLRQQLYLVQGNGAAPQPIHQAGPSRYQTRTASAGMAQEDYGDQVDVEGFSDLLDNNYG